MASHSTALRARQRVLSPAVLLGVVGCLAAMALVIAWLRMPFGEMSVLITYMVVSSLSSGVVGFVTYRLSEAGRRSIRTKIMLAHALGAGVVIANIFAVAQLMFISAHDLGVLILLLVFCALFSITFGAAVASRLTTAVATLSEGARQVSRGKLDTRVQVSTNDELAELARSFNEMVAQVNVAAESRERAEAARRELVAAVSHDLRTPLTAIRAMLEALSDGVVDDPETVARYHTTMRAQVEHLSRLIDDLFELSQIESGGQRYELQRLDLAAVVSDAVEAFAMSASARGVTLELRAPGPLPAPIEPTKLARVLHNLLDNAVRHAPPGSTVEVTLAREPAAARVSVRDHGEGVQPADLPHVFDRFYRGEKSRSRSYGGAGLGLAIAQGVVCAHGGQIAVRNAPDGGAEFTFTVPL
jgi:signal transduction histidine kinase